MTYDKQCDYGRQQAAYAIDDARATDNLPRLVRKIRDAASDKTGEGIGFLFKLAEMSTRQPGE